MKTSLGKIAASILMLLIAGSRIAYSQNDDFASEEDLFDDEFSKGGGAKIADPLEPVNRVIFGFNDFVYTELGRPLANTYQAITPDPVEKGLNNFFNNLAFPVRFTSNVLQGRIGRAGKETLRFTINTTAGLAGFFDEASEHPDLEVPREDLGQAFGKWGFGEGFYIVIPFLGPSNLRDLVGLIGDRYPDVISEPWSVLDGSEERFAASAVEFVSDSPELMDTYESYKGSAIDPYSGIRDAYTQFRKREIEE